MNRRVVYMAAVFAVMLTIIALLWGGMSTQSGAQAGAAAGAAAPTGGTPLYAVIIDAGSSGSRLHVYTYTMDLPSQPQAPRRLWALPAPAAAATRRWLGRVSGSDGGGSAAAKDTQAVGATPGQSHGQGRDLGSGSADRSAVQGRGGSHGSGGHGSPAGGGNSPRSPHHSGVPLLQRYPQVQLPGRVHRINPGLSSLAPAGEGAADYLAPLLDFARQQVPSELHAATPIRLLATAGLRLLPEEQQQQVLAAAAEVLAGSGFLFVRPKQQHPRQQQQQQQMAQLVPQALRNRASPAPSVQGGYRDLYSSSSSSSRPEQASANNATAELSAGGSGSSGGRVPEEEVRAEAAVAAGSVDWIRVLSGDQEGLYAWAGINFAAGRLQALAAQAAVSPRQRDAAAWLQSEAASTLAVFELGGASMQVTLMPWEPLPGGLGHTLALPGVTRPLYTHSFLGYGLHVAWFRGAMLVAGGGGGGGEGEAATDPCLNPGYTSQSSGVTGSGNFSACVALAEQLLGVEAQQQQQQQQQQQRPGGAGSGCKHSRCSIGTEYLPSLLPPFNRTGSGSPASSSSRGSSSSGGSSSSSGSSGSSSGFLIMATEAFHYTISHLQLQPSCSLQALAAAGAAFCARPWAEVERELVQGRGVDEEHALKLCFGAAYIHTMLSKGFKLSAAEAAHLRFSNWVTRPDGTQVEVNWVLGALLAEVVPEQLRRLARSHPGQQQQQQNGRAAAATAEAAVAAVQPLGANASGGGTGGGAARARGLLAGGMVALVLVSGLLCCGLAAAGGEAGLAAAGGRSGVYRSRRGGGPAPPAGAGLSAALASVVVKVVDGGGGGGAGAGGAGGAGGGGGWVGGLSMMWGGAVDAAAYAAAHPQAVAGAGMGPAAAGVCTAGSQASPSTVAAGAAPGALSLIATLGLGPRDGSHGGGHGSPTARVAQRRAPSGLQASSGLAVGAGVAGGGGCGPGEEDGAAAPLASLAMASGSMTGVAGSLEQRRGARAAVAML
ncbi:hypothetical protein HYH02_009800 [Chlamydomonas schloesseri]|uniref:Apyrase n=1 Tax=Chlamydomonas schloesseri TaxID=2026947 RepID=A0A835TEP5_9CHLO|nr:hypothetical protein HYH02_009800 [Chlamydomonas schloesseri]|eukprot:KAG2442008.1 hypothetical protein HYH02_009800 [Chlamydomonas schloesseri]